MTVICDDGPRKASAFVDMIQCVSLCVCTSTYVSAPSSSSPLQMWTELHFPTCQSILLQWKLERACHNEAKLLENQQSSNSIKEVLCASNPWGPLMQRWEENGIMKALLPVRVSFIVNNRFSTFLWILLCFVRHFKNFRKEIKKNKSLILLMVSTCSKASFLFYFLLDNKNGWNFFSFYYILCIFTLRIMTQICLPKFLRWILCAGWCFSCTFSSHRFQIQWASVFFCKKIK